MQQTLQHAGQTVYINVSPCSWMYLDYGLQFSLSLRENAPNCACEFVLHKEKAGMHKDDMPTFARVFAQAWLEANGLSKLEAAIVRTDAMKAQFAKAADVEAARRTKLIQQYKAKGYTHHFMGVVHRNGDDKVVEAFTMGVPDAASIAKLLRGSKIKTDYKVSAL